MPKKLHYCWPQNSFSPSLAFIDKGVREDVDYNQDEDEVPWQIVTQQSYVCTRKNMFLMLTDGFIPFKNILKM